MLTGLGQVDDGSTHQGAEDTTLEAMLAGSHMMAERRAELTLLMVKVPPAISSMVSLLSRAYRTELAK